MNPSDDDLDQLARKRAGAKLRWYAHATLYLVVNVALDLASDQGFGHRHWSYQPVLGWGVGLMFHAASVWLFGQGSDLREAMVRKERERLLRQREQRNLD